MPATEAQLLANRRNAQRSKGPVTPEGKERSRANSLKHGLTGEGIVLTEEDAAEVEQMAANLESELRPSGTMGRVLVRRIATHVVRMDRSVLQETAALSDRVQQAEADFEAPEGLDDVEVDRLRLEAGRRAMFDPSKEATLARKYEAAAERGFFRALKEFRQVERDAKAATSGPDVAAAREQLGSFFPAAKPASAPVKPPVAAAQMPPKPASTASTTPPKPASTAWNPFGGSSFDVPITIGRAR